MAKNRMPSIRGQDLAEWIPAEVDPTSFVNEAPQERKGTVRRPGHLDQGWLVTSG